jgi:hypothetical protein
MYVMYVCMCMQCDKQLTYQIAEKHFTFLQSQLAPLRVLLQVLARGGHEVEALSTRQHVIPEGVIRLMIKDRSRVA